MACRLEVTCYTKFGETLMMSGSDPSLGSWDLSRAVELKTDEEAFPVWSVNLNMPPPGTEFKFVILLPYGAGAAWEQLACNRRWSAEIFGEGRVVVSAKFGHGGLSISSTSEAIVCAACPEEHQLEVAAICKANKIMKAFSHWPDKMDPSWVVQAWREWEAKVLTAVVGLVNEREASAVRIVCVEGGPWANMQKAKQPDLLNAVCNELGDPSFNVSVVWMTLSSFKGEYLRRRGNTPLVASRPTRANQPLLAVADAAAGSTGLTGSDAVAKGIVEALASAGHQRELAPWQLGERRGLPGAKAVGSRPPLELARFVPARRGSTGSTQTTAPDLVRLAEELYGPGSDEANFISKRFGGHVQLPLPRPDEGADYYDQGLGPEETDDVAPIADCKYFDLSPAPREDVPQSPSKKDICIDKRRVSSRQRSFWESKQPQQNIQATPTTFTGSAEDRARSNSVPLIGRNSRKHRRRNLGTDRDRHSSGSFGGDSDPTSLQEEDTPARQQSDSFSMEWERSMSSPQPPSWIPKVVVSEAAGGFPPTVTGG